jgi:hypothetical protein
LLEGGLGCIGLGLLWWPKLNVVGYFADSLAHPQIWQKLFIKARLILLQFLFSMAFFNFQFSKIFTGRTIYLFSCF